MAKILGSLGIQMFSLPDRNFPMAEDQTLKKPSLNYGSHSTMIKPLHKIGDEVYYLTFHGMRAARVIKVYRSSTNIAYDLETDAFDGSYMGVERFIKIKLPLEEKDVFKSANA
jgi:hypothetical protein